MLRAIFLFTQGLSHDELSAWNRIGNYNIWQTLEFGVAPDMHPAFMQLLLQYWTQIFGDSELSLRTTSTLFGLAGIALIYLLGYKFLSKNAGLWAAIPFLLFVFPIIHSTFARPYALGFFFCMLFVYGIFLLKNASLKSSRIAASVALIFAGVLALYTHYYAGLVCTLIGVFALFFLGRKNLFVLIASGFVIALLFLPHWSIAQEQLSRGGLGWLGKPEIHWLTDFFVLFFNDSAILAWAICIAFLLLLFKFGLKMSAEAKFLLLIFFGVYAISHLLSIVYTPILREPGMLFVLPFLFLSLADGLKKVQVRHSNYTKVGVLLATFGTTLFFGKINKNVHFEPFREMTELVKKYDDQLGENNILKFCNVTNINYLDYYARKNGAQLKFEMTLIEDADEIHEMARIIQQSDKPYLVLARTNRAQNVIQYELIRHYFPELVVHHDFANANFSVWKKNNAHERKFIKSISNENSPTLFGNWLSDTTKNEYIGNLHIKASDLEHKNSYVLVKSHGWIDSACTDLNLVTVLVRDGEIVLKEELPLLYQAWDQIKMNPITGEREFFTAFELPKKIKSSDEIHIYFWNRTFASVLIHKPTVYVLQANH